MKVEWTDLASDRVLEIALYIAQDSLREAEKWVSEIYGYVKRLESFPNSGRYVLELTNRKDIRELVFGNYRIIYRIEKDTVFILTVRSYKQILPLKDINF